MKLPDSEYDYVPDPIRNTKELKYLIFKLLMLLLRYYVHDAKEKHIFIDTRVDDEKINGIYYQKYVLYIQVRGSVLQKNFYSRVFPSPLCLRGINDKRIDDNWYLCGFKFTLKDFRLPYTMYNSELKRRILENIFNIVTHMTVTNVNFYLPEEFMSSRLLFDKHYGEEDNTFNNFYIPYFHFDWTQLDPMFEHDLWDSVRILHAYIDELDKHMKEVLFKK
jgi:hypothetical protein